MEAIQAATTVAAELLRIEGRTGSIQKGYEADLIVVDRNPLESVLYLQDVLLVVNDGKVVLDRLNFGLQIMLASRPGLPPSPSGLRRGFAEALRAMANAPLARAANAV